MIPQNWNRCHSFRCSCFSLWPFCAIANAKSFFWDPSTCTKALLTVKWFLSEICICFEWKSLNGSDWDMTAKAVTLQQMSVMINTGWFRHHMCFTDYSSRKPNACFIHLLITAAFRILREILATIGFLQLMLWYFFNLFATTHFCMSPIVYFLWRLCARSYQILFTLPVM